MPSNPDTSGCTSVAQRQYLSCSTHSEVNMSASESGYSAPDLSLRGEEHVRVYRETGGESGYLWNGVPTLLLTVTGRTSGRDLTSALIFARDGDDLLVVASKGGA